MKRAVYIILIIKKWPPPAHKIYFTNGHRRHTLYFTILYTYTYNIHTHTYYAGIHSYTILHSYIAHRTRRRIVVEYTPARVFWTQFDPSSVSRAGRRVGIQSDSIQTTDGCRVGECHSDSGGFRRLLRVNCHVRELSRSGYAAPPSTSAQVVEEMTPPRLRDHHGRSKCREKAHK